jgi:hypothetical protein
MHQDEVEEKVKKLTTELLRRSVATKTLEGFTSWLGLLRPGDWR